MRTPAKFLVLVDGAPRALLFDNQRRLIGEVIEEDGFIVACLLQHALACSMPPASDDEPSAWAVPSASRWYELGATAIHSAVPREALH